MIEIKDLCAGYGNEEILHNINLRLELGKVTVLIGKNGCGKSTLLKSLIRLNPHSAGTITVDGQEIEKLKANELAKKIAYLPQGKNVPDISVRRMVLHGRFSYLNYPRRYRKIDYDITENAMRWVGIEDLAEKNMNQLSGGMQQKVYVAMVLAQDASVILMDEPTVFLDISYQLKLMKLARKLANEGKAVVMVLHDLTQAFRYADKIVVMDDGKILDCGSPEDLFSKKIIDSVFQIELRRVHTESGYQYYLSDEEESEKFTL